MYQRYFTVLKRLFVKMLSKMHVNALFTFLLMQCFFECFETVSFQLLCVLARLLTGNFISDVLQATLSDEDVSKLKSHLSAVEV